VFIFGQVGNAGASGSFTMTVAGARAAKACLPRSKVDPSAAPVCFPGNKWVSALPSYARSSTKRFDLCSVALGITAVGDLVFLPALFDPFTAIAYVETIGTEAEVLKVCYG
jgi:hypothetical protein